MAYGFGVQNPWVRLLFSQGLLLRTLRIYRYEDSNLCFCQNSKRFLQISNSGLKLAFRSGAVMGLVVVGLGLLDISIWYIILNNFIDVTGAQKLVIITTTMLTFGWSPHRLSCQGRRWHIYKGSRCRSRPGRKVEAQIPEDDLRNPATIADNVGDNVGDVGGMGADLYESYCGSILATAAFEASAFYLDLSLQLKAVLHRCLSLAVGYCSRFLGFYVKDQEGAWNEGVAGSLGRE